MIADIMHYLDNWIPRFEHDNRSYLTVAIGCTGGQHRSVYITEALQKCAEKKHRVQLRHRDMPKN
jgi:UPF0042 nucleotide-binding protein